MLLDRQAQARERQSIWSVPGHLWRWYVALFVIQYFAFLGLIVWAEAFNQGANDPIQVLINVQQSMTASILNMAASTYLVLEGVMLAQWLRERDRKREQEAIDKAEGQLRQWQDWYERMQSAEKKGLPFDEPPPGQEGNHQQTKEL